MANGKRELAIHFVTFLPKIPQKKGKIKRSRQTQTYSFLRTRTKRQTAEVEFLPFVGKTNVMLNLSLTHPMQDCESLNRAKFSPY